MRGGGGGTFSLSHHEMVRPPQPIGRGPTLPHGTHRYRPYSGTDIGDVYTVNS